MCVWYQLRLFKLTTYYAKRKFATNRKSREVTYNEYDFDQFFYLKIQNQSKSFIVIDQNQFSLHTAPFSNGLQNERILNETLVNVIHQQLFKTIFADIFMYTKPHNITKNQPLSVEYVISESDIIPHFYNSVFFDRKMNIFTY